MRKPPETSRPSLRSDAPPANPFFRSRMTAIALAHRGLRSNATRYIPAHQASAHEP